MRYSSSYGRGTLRIIMDLIVAFVIHGDTLEMGLATSMSYYAGLAVLLLHFRKKDILLRFSFRGIPWRETAGIITKGLPVGVSRLSNTFRSAFMNGLLAVIASSAAIAAYSVQRQADSFLNPMTIGMADTVAVLAGFFYGEASRTMMRRLIYVSIRATLTHTLVVAVLAWIFAPQFAGLFIKGSPEALRYSIRAVRAYAVGMPFYGLSLIYFNYFQGVGKSRLSSVAGFLSEGGFLVLSAWGLSRWFGADAIWFAFPATQVLMFMLYSVEIAVWSRKLGIRDRDFWDRLLLLPNDFDVPEEDRMEKSITTMDEVAELSRAVWDFCEDHKCKPKLKYHMSLAVEEMAGNVIEHGFSLDNKKHSVDVRVAKKGEEYILRIRDNCEIFDPIKRLELYSDEDLVHHLGIRMIVNTSEEMQHTSLLKLNNLLIKVR